jgi:hypothetical protein
MVLLTVLIFVSAKTEITAVGIRHADHVSPTSPTSGGRSVGVVRSRTQATEFIIIIIIIIIMCSFWFTSFPIITIIIIIINWI